MSWQSPDLPTLDELPADLPVAQIGDWTLTRRELQILDRLTPTIARAVARVFLARWYERTAPPPPCPDRGLHGEHWIACSTCLCSAAMARDFQQYERQIQIVRCWVCDEQPCGCAPKEPRKLADEIEQGAHCGACGHAPHVPGECRHGWSPVPAHLVREPGWREDEPGSGCECGEPWT